MKRNPFAPAPVGYRTEERMSIAPPPPSMSYRSEVRASYAAPARRSYYATTALRGLGNVAPGRKLEALAILGAGLLTAATLVLHFKGHRGAATALGATGAIAGAVIGAVKLLSSD